MYIPEHLVLVRCVGGHPDKDEADVPLDRVGAGREVDLHLGILVGWISCLGGYLRLNDNAQWSRIYRD